MARTATKTVQRLQKRMREVQTWQQFEEIIAAAPDDDRSRIRRLLEPMLREDLPCCGPAMLCVAAGADAIEHGPRCPTTNKVQIFTH